MTQQQEEIIYNVFNIMCNMQACDIFRTLSERMAKITWKCAHYSIICCMFYAKCQEEEGLPFVPDDKAFIST